MPRRISCAGVGALLCLLASVVLVLCFPSPVLAFDPSKYDVDWTAPSAAETESMPLGNGDITANIWVEAATSDLMYYAQSSSAWEENGQLIKLIRGRLHLNASASASSAPPVLANFHHHLHIANASQTVSYDSGALHVQAVVWIDRFHPVLHFNVSTSSPVQAVHSIEMWRVHNTSIDGWTGGYYCDARTVYPDVLYSGSGLGGRAGELLWYHRNDGDSSDRYYDSALRRQSLDGIGLERINPLIDRTFGGYITHYDADGSQWSAAQTVQTAYGLSSSLSSLSPLASIGFSLYSHTGITPTVDEYLMQFALTVGDIQAVSRAAALQAHNAYWAAFLSRSYVELTLTDAAQAFVINQQLLLQRLTDAMNGMNQFPIHFNGQGWFIGSGDRTGPDYRGWGSAMWWQNTRQPYYAAVQSGDMDILRPAFDFYARILQVQEARVQAYYGHGGAYYDETLTVYGLMVDAGFGYTCDGTKEVHGNTYIRYHWDGSFELCLLMLDYYHYTNDLPFLQLTLIPVCSAVMQFFYVHYPRDSSGRTVFYPSQSLETWQCGNASQPERCVTNSVVFIVGLQATLTALLRLPAELVSETLRRDWSQQLDALPDIPIGVCPTNHDYTCLLPAEKYLNETSNSENVELYAVWPYRLYTLGQDGYDTIMNNYRLRLFPCNYGWCQDIVDAALLGLRADTAAQIIERSQASPATGWKFPTFVGPMQDSTPAVDHFTTQRAAVHAMLMQEIPSDQFSLRSLEQQVGADSVWCVDRARWTGDGKREGGSVILLFGALPQSGWDVEFKLVATGPTVIEGRCANNTLTALTVQPVERKGDIILAGCGKQEGSVMNQMQTAQGNLEQRKEAEGRAVQRPLQSAAE